MVTGTFFLLSSWERVKVRGLDSGQKPLTPALSLRERE
jgi:hypothetical protein